MTTIVSHRRIFIGGTTKFQNHERLSKQKREIKPLSVMRLISTLSKHFFCSGTYNTGLKVLCTFFVVDRRSVDYAKKRFFGVSDWHVFHQIAVDVY